MAGRATDLYQTLIRAIKSDARRSAILGALIIVLAGLWIRMGMQAAGGVATAKASPAQPAAEPGGPQLSGAEAAARAAMDEWLSAPVPPLGRNLFAVKLDYFPREEGQAIQEKRLGEGFWDELEKSLSAQADQRRERQVLVQNLRLQASQLRLQSTLMGSAPRAVINGAMVGEGDVVEGFRVLKIEARRIIVEREGIRLEIPMM